MKNTLALVGLLVVGVAGLGWYLGWYQVSSTPGALGHASVVVDVNKAKISQDIGKGEQKVIEIINKSQTTTEPQGVPVSIPVTPDDSIPQLLPPPPQ